MKKTVKFLKPWKIYTAGDVAGFDEEQAQALVKAKAAEPYEEAQSETKAKLAK